MRHIRGLFISIILVVFIIGSCKNLTTKQHSDVFGKWHIVGIDTSGNINDNNDFNIVFFIESIKDNNLSLEIDSNNIIVFENGLVIETIDIHNVNNDEISYSTESNNKLKEGIIKYQEIDNNNFNLLFSNGYIYKLQRIKK